MPDMDGYAFSSSIRALEKETLQHTPIIAMTANAMPEDRKKCLDAGMDSYITKPLNLNIVRVLGKYL